MPKLRYFQPRTETNKPRFDGGAAIRALTQQLKQKDLEIARLQRELNDLEDKNARQFRMIAALASKAESQCD